MPCGAARGGSLCGYQEDCSLLRVALHGSENEAFDAGNQMESASTQGFQCEDPA